MYDQAQGVPQDFKQALKWYLLAAGQGYADAQRNLGLMYRRCARRSAGLQRGSQVVPALAADQGVAEAQYNLGLDVPRRPVAFHGTTARRSNGSGSRPTRVRGSAGQPRRHVSRGPGRSAGLQRGPDGSVSRPRKERRGGSGQPGRDVRRWSRRSAGLRRGAQVVPSGR